MELLFYHSKPNEDPLGLGKRMTVACLVDNNKMCFGIAKTNNKDTFVRSIGRKVAEGRAKTAAIMVDEQPLGKDEKETHNLTRKAFVEKAKLIVKERIRSQKEFDLFRNKPSKPSKVSKEIENRTKKLFRALAKSINPAPVHRSGKVIELQPTAIELHAQ